MDETQQTAPVAENAAPADWRASLPEDLRSEKSIASIKDVGALARGYVEAQRYIGGSYRIPGQDAPAEEWDHLYAKLGRPESPDKYETKVSSRLRSAFPEPDEASYREMAHRFGLSTKQAQGVLDWYDHQYGSHQDDLARAAKDTASELQQLWGGAYEKNLALAQRTVREMGGHEVIEFLDTTGLGNSPALIRMLARVGAALAEDGAISAEVEGVLGVDDAKSKIAGIMNDKDHAYHKRDRAGHEESVQEMRKLFELAYPTVL
jgi:hypothetical protein